MEKEWAELSPDEKREERFKRWLSPPDVKFSSPEAEKAYKERVTRLINAIQLKEPDRVPVMLHAGVFPAHYVGITLQTIMYDYDELRRAWKKFIHEFDMDTCNGPNAILPGKAYENLDCKTYKWPGHGLSPDTMSYQFVEGDYMKADEYNALISDPSDFAIRAYMPRVFGAFEPFKSLPPFSTVLGMPHGLLIPFSLPDVQAAFQALVDAGKESTKWLAAVRDCEKEQLESGIPRLWSLVAIAPFDTIADTLRGTQGVIMDMYRQPDKLLDAMKKITPLTIETTVSEADAMECPVIFMPLHKGDDSFMSGKQYETFYWPTLKKVVMGLINEGFVPFLFAEGSYMTRLEIIKDLPRGAAIWWFDQTDMARAKEVLGDTTCIAGNLPTSLLCTGTPQDIKEYCRKLIEVAGKGGGFILTQGACIDIGNPDNIHVIMEAAKEYGVYR